MDGRRRDRKVLGGAVACAALLACGGHAQDADETSRARWWLTRDAVEPLADLVNTAPGDAPPRFEDRAGGFTVRAEGERALVLSGTFPRATIWRFDLCTRDGSFDMRTLYVEDGWCPAPDADSPGTRAVAAVVRERDRASTHTGPWEIHRMRWRVPTARVALDGTHVYTSWFDLPSIDDLAAGRLVTSFALDVERPGPHTVRIAFDDFPHGVRNADGTRTPAPRGYDTNPLRVGDVASIAVGEDERVRDLRDEDAGAPAAEVPVAPGVRPRKPPPRPWTRERVEPFIEFVDPDRGEPWEYNLDLESMASDNDMDTGRHGWRAALQFARMEPHLEEDARAAWRDAYLRRFEGLYRFSVFQRNYHPTGYAQNHAAGAVAALLAGAAGWRGPEAIRWRRWGAMVCRKRIELLGRDGGLEWMNEARDHGLDLFARDLQLLDAMSVPDLRADQPFFENEWRYALHRAPSFPGEGRAPALRTLVPHDGRRTSRTGKSNVRLPPGVTADGTPTDHHFDDVDEVCVRAGWEPQDLRARLVAGVPFSKATRSLAKRYNWAHVQVNRGSFTLSQGAHDLVLEPGATRTYRKSAAQNNCIVVDGIDQWGGGHVYHPRLTEERIPRMAAFAAGDALSVARADLENAYPPAARVRSISRVLVHVRPGCFLLFDRVETHGDAEVEWRFHTPFPEPVAGVSGHYVLHAHENRAPFPYAAFAFDEAYEKVADVRCEMAFLAPAGVAGIGLTDVVYRVGRFPHPPMRHVSQRSRGGGPHVLLTAFARTLRFGSPAAGVFERPGDAGCTVLVGAREHGDLQTDAHVAVIARRGERVEVYRFGGSFVRVGPLRIEDAGSDHFVVVDAGRVVRAVGSLR